MHHWALVLPGLRSTVSQTLVIVKSAAEVISTCGHKTVCKEKDDNHSQSLYTAYLFYHLTTAPHSTPDYY